MPNNATGGFGLTAAAAYVRMAVWGATALLAAARAGRATREDIIPTGLSEGVVETGKGVEWRGVDASRRGPAGLEVPST